MNKFNLNAVTRILASILLLIVTVTLSASAASGETIDKRVDKSLERFYNSVNGGKELIEKAAGVLVFPRVVKAGFVFGAEHGEGALRVNGKTEGYYNTSAASFGFQVGVQRKTMVFVFMTPEALGKFTHSDGWKIGVDASVALVRIGEGGSIDTEQLNKPVLAFVIGRSGFMYNLTLEGAKISRIRR